MSFLSSDYLFIYFGYNMLSVYGAGMSAPKTFVFSSTIIAHQEILDRLAWDKQLLTFLDPFKRRHAVIVLSGDITYAASLGIVDKKSFLEKVNDMEDMLPFDSEKMAMKLIDLNKQLYFIGANRELYSSIISAATHLSISIKDVVPLALFTKQPDVKILSYDFFMKLFVDRILFEKGNFLLRGPLEISYEEQKMTAQTLASVVPGQAVPVPRRQYIILSAAIVFFVAALIYAFFTLGIVATLFKK